MQEETQVSGTYGLGWEERKPQVLGRILDSLLSIEDRGSFG